MGLTIVYLVQYWIGAKMLEIDITKQAQAYLNDSEPFPLTGSVMQLGEDAAKVTWNNTLNSNDVYSYVTDDNIELISNYFDNMGIELRERERLDKEVLNAIMIQYIDLELKESDIYSDYSSDYDSDYIFVNGEKIYIQIDTY